jgi:hypothetical protein
MKPVLTLQKVFCLLLFSSSYLCCYAQQDIDDDPEKVLQTFVKEFNQNDAGFFTSRLSKDFRYTDGSGTFLKRDDIIKNSEGGKARNSSVSDVKSFREGNLAVVSGIHTFENNDKVAFTYTLVKQNGKWHFAASQHTGLATAANK